MKITQWTDGATLFESDHPTMKETVEAAREANTNLHWAYLRGANLYEADLRGADINSGIPKIPDIHRTLYNELAPTVNGDGTPKNLDMDSWHGCDTTHCRAGWITTLAGQAGACLEGQIGTGPAAALIYMASDPTLEKIPNWITSNQDAWADIKRLAGAVEEGIK